MGSASNIKVNAYVGVVLCTAAAVVAYQRAFTPSSSMPWAEVTALLALSVLADLLSHRLPKGGAASVAFIPLVAAVIFAPMWTTVLSVGVSVLAVQVYQRKPPVRALFNVAQTVLGVSLAALIYIASGGAALSQQPSIAFGMAIMDFGLPAAVALVVFSFTNTLLVSVAIALSSGQSAIAVWRANTLLTLVHLIFATPGAFVLAWIAVQLGPIGVVLLSIPLLGMRQLYNTSYDLEKVNQELLELMIKAIEARDPYTSGHSRRVSDTVRLIASAMGLNERDIDRVTVAGLLHDVGKIHEVFAPILQKPGRLTDEEWSVMKTHPARGAELAGTVSHLKYAVPAIRGHHENWDGTGYPDGLAGDRIPLAARIISVADTIDALTSDRPYRRKLTSADVRAELVRCRGTQFDPAVCDAVLTAETWRKLFPESSQPTPSSILALRRRNRPSTEVAGM